MRWRNETRTVQLIYDNMWNQFYVKPGGTIDDVNVPSTKLIGVLSPIQTKPVIGVILNRARHNNMFKLIRRTDAFSFVELPLFSERRPTDYLRDRYLQILRPDAVIVFDDGDGYKNLISMCKVFSIPVFFVVSSLRQHTSVSTIYSDVVLTYSDYSKKEFEAITSKKVVATNYLQMGVGAKLTKKQRDINNKILVLDTTSASQIAITAIKDVYNTIKKWNVPSVYSYSFNSPQLSTIRNSYADIATTSVVVATPTFDMLQAAMQNIPVVKLDYEQNTLPDLRFNIKNKPQIVTEIRKALKASKEDLKRQSLALKKFCTLSKEDLFSKAILEVLHD